MTSFYRHLWALVLGVVAAVTAAPTCMAGGGAEAASRVARLDPETTLSLLGEVDVGSAAAILDGMAKIEAKKNNSVTLVIDSPGGFVDPGLRVVVALRSFQARSGKVRCIVTGEAMSMAYYILGACGERLVMARSQLLWHPIRIGVRGGLTGEAALAIGQSLLAFEQSMKEEMINEMGVDPDWFDMHWRAETSHHGSDLAVAAPQFVRVIDGINGLPMSATYWIEKPSFLDSLIPTDEQGNGARYWGPRSN